MVINRNQCAPDLTTVCSGTQCYLTVGMWYNIFDSLPEFPGFTETAIPILPLAEYLVVLSLTYWKIILILVLLSRSFELGHM